MRKQEVHRFEVKSADYLTTAATLSSLGINKVICYSKSEFLNNPQLAKIANCLSERSRNAMYNDGDSYCLFGHVQNNNESSIYSEYYIFDTFRLDDDTFDRDPILIPIGDDAKPVGYAYQMTHGANGYDWATKHMPVSCLNKIKLLREDAPAHDLSDVSTLVPELSAEFSEPIQSLELQMSDVDKYWDGKKKRTLSGDAYSATSSQNMIYSSEIR